MRTLDALLVPAVAAALSCSGADGPRRWTGTVDTLESGAILISNPSAGILGDDPLPFVEETRIGSVEGGGPDTFGAVVAIEVDRLGRIYALDRQAQEVRVFEADGRYVRTLGRAGEGPGEFRGANGMGWGAPDRLWVIDKRLDRFNVFDTSGVSVATHRALMTVRAWSWRGGFADGHAYDNQIDINDPERRDIILRFDTLTQWADTFPAPVPAGFDIAVFNWQDSRGLGRIMLVPYAPVHMWRLSPQAEVWTGISSAYRISRLSLHGDTLQVVEREYTPVPVTPDERDAALEQVHEAAEGHPYDPSRIPTVKPAFARFETDGERRLWVQLPYDAAQGVTGFDVFDPAGRYLGQMRVPYRAYPYAPFIVRHDKLYFVAVDELDVPYVVAARLEPGLRDTGGIPLRRMP